MARYALWRALISIPLLLVISMMLFGMVHLTPGGPASIYAADPQASPDVIERLERLWGLDRPLHVQYTSWLSELLRGNWGRSLAQRRPVIDIVRESVPNTLLLTLSALAISLAFGVPAGVFAATTARKWLQAMVQTLAVLGMSIPTFWLGSMVILVFSVQLRWIPAGGMASIHGPSGLLDAAQHLVGPTIVLAALYIAMWARYVDAALSEVLREDYIRTARGKGLARMRVLLKHAMPNAALPLVTVLGLQIGRLLSGTIVTEIVFSWPGLGRVFMRSLLGRDYAVSMGVMVLLSILVITANLITDLAYAVIDPRIRYQ